MKDFLSKNKILISIIGAMLVIAIVLLVIILNNKDNNEDTGSQLADKLTTTPAETQADNQPTDTSQPDATSEVGELVTITDGAGLEENPTEVVDVPDETEEENILRIFDVSVELGDYHSIKSDIVPTVITDDDVQARIDQNLESEMKILDMEARPLKNGDMVIVSVKGFKNGKEVEELTFNNYQAILGRDMLVKEIEEQLIGHQKGDNFETDIKLESLSEVAPEYSKEIFHFNIDIVDSFEVYIPKLTDEYIKMVAGYDTVAEYRDYLKQALQSVEDAKAYDERSKDILNQVIAVSTFSGQIEEEIDYMYQSEYKRLDELHIEEDSLTADQYYKMYFYETPDEFHDRLRREIEENVKSREVLNAIAQKENLSVSQEEYDAKFNEIFFETYGFVSEESVRSQIPQENIDYIVNSTVLREKALDILMNQ